MKKLFVLICIVSSCSKPVDVDTRDSVIGTYIVSAKRTISAGNKTDVRTDSNLLLTISKGSTAKEIVFFDNEYWRASYSQNRFATDTYTTVQQGKTYNVVSSGLFDGKNIRYTETISGNGITQVSEISGNR